MARRLRIPKAKRYAQSRTAATLSDATFGLLYATGDLPRSPGSRPNNAHTSSIEDCYGLPCGQAAPDRPNATRVAARKIDYGGRRRAVERREARGIGARVVLGFTMTPVVVRPGRERRRDVDSRHSPQSRRRAQRGVPRLLGTSEPDVE
jgi:hypothetical protein